MDAPLVERGTEQASDPLARSPSYLGIHAVNIYVRDQEASLRFFVDKLGFEVAFDGQLQTGDRWVAVTPPDGTAVLALVAPKPESKEYRLVGRTTGIVLVAENVIARYEEWRRRGVEFLFTPRLRRVKYTRSGLERAANQQAPVWGAVFTRFKDIDGNRFSLAGFDEVNREIEAHRRRTLEKQEAERRAAQELEIARQVQARLFPQRQSLTPALEYAGACVQARQVGGDYHDYLDLGRGRVGLVIADISGKGIAAALLMANLQAHLRSQCAGGVDDLGCLLDAVNRLFHENTGDSSYATLFFAEYDCASERLRYANCGHLPPLLVHRDSTVDRLDSTCTVLGLFKQWKCGVEERPIHPGDLLVLYTDGITESFNEAGEEFGDERLLDAVRGRPEIPADALIAAVVEEVRQFSPREQHDDITLMLARFRGGTPG